MHTHTANMGLVDVVKPPEDLTMEEFNHQAQRHFREVVNQLLLWDIHNCTEAKTDKDIAVAANIAAEQQMNDVFTGLRFAPTLASDGVGGVCDPLSPDCDDRQQKAQNPSTARAVNDTLRAWLQFDDLVGKAGPEVGKTLGSIRSYTCTRALNVRICAELRTRAHCSHTHMHAQTRSGCLSHTNGSTSQLSTRSSPR